MILSTTVTLRGSKLPADFPEGARSAQLIKRPTRGKGTKEPCPACKGGEGKANCIKCEGLGTMVMATMARINFADTNDEDRAAALVLNSWAKAHGLRCSTVLRIAEYGGILNGHIGNAVCISGPTGEKLRSRGAPKGNEHASFWVERALVADITRTGDTINGVIKVMDTTPDLEPRATPIFRVKNGVVEKIGTHEYKVPEELLEAARKKTAMTTPEAVYAN